MMKQWKACCNKFPAVALSMNETLIINIQFIASVGVGGWSGIISAYSHITMVDFKQTKNNV